MESSSMLLLRRACKINCKAFVYLNKSLSNATRLSQIRVFSHFPEICHEEILTLVPTKQGFRFSAKHTTVEQIESLSMKEMSQKIRNLTSNIYFNPQRLLESRDSQRRVAVVADEDIDDKEKICFNDLFDEEEKSDTKRFICRSKIELLFGRKSKRIS
jgi:hypothetical protein